ncbi:MAG: dienelactone hydrolase family protein [Bacteroidia bacterium]|nr:dienelactone hydrolase family protein [Bacteroidia bacterium]MDW8089507.1 dienelactone hydrolase family protein [Bacteroidia bacterium]
MRQFFRLVSFPGFIAFAQIGHRTFVFNDPTRSGGFGSGGGPGRQIQTEIYYPAAQSGDNTPIQSGAFPVVVIGHGFLMPWSAYQNLWEQLVPAGYIVALPRTESGFSPSHRDFALDLRLVGERLLAEGQNPSSPFYGRIYPRLALMGHSMGGGCAILAAANFSGAHCVVGLAAANTHPSAIQAAAQVTLPTLIIAGSGDSVTPPSQHQLPIYNNLAAACKAYVSLTGGGHCYFANPDAACDFGENSAGSTVTLTRAQQQALTLQILRPFLEAYLKDSCPTRFMDTLAGLPSVTYLITCAYLRLSLSAQVSPPTPENPTGGNISLSVQGGQPPYQYTWSHGFTGPNPTNLGPGTYRVVVRDARGCTAETTFTLNLSTFLRSPSSYSTPRAFCSAGSLYLELPAPYIGRRWRLLDTAGRLLAEGYTYGPHLTLPLPSGPPVLYLLTIEDWQTRLFCPP